VVHGPGPAAAFQVGQKVRPGTWCFQLGGCGKPRTNLPPRPPGETRPYVPWFSGERQPEVSGWWSRPCGWRHRGPVAEGEQQASSARDAGDDHSSSTSVKDRLFAWVGRTGLGKPPFGGLCWATI